MKMLSIEIDDNVFDMLKNNYMKYVDIKIDDKDKISILMNRQIKEIYYEEIIL